MQDHKRGRGHRTATCEACLASTHAVVAAKLTDYTWRVRGARSLLKLGLSTAALQVLDGGPLPSVPEARAMQTNPLGR